MRSDSQALWRQGNNDGMRMSISALAFAAALLGVAAAEPPQSADGPRPYYVVFLRPNPARKAIPQPDRERIMAAHMANIHKMADDGVLVAAGPMDDKPTTISGIFFFRTGSLEEARHLAGLDPTVVEGRNTVDVHIWRGPEGIGANYFKWKKEHPEAQDVMASHAFCILLRNAASPATRLPDPGHEAYVESLHHAGALAAAGAVDDDPVIEGFVIFKTDSLDDAKRNLAGDPAVASGRLVPEFHRWWSADRVMPW
jgi:uncharacterized protein YciI